MQKYVIALYIRLSIEDYKYSRRCPGESPLPRGSCLRNS